MIIFIIVLLASLAIAHKAAKSAANAEIARCWARWHYMQENSIPVAAAPLWVAALAHSVGAVTYPPNEYAIRRSHQKKGFLFSLVVAIATAMVFS